MVNKNHFSRAMPHLDQPVFTIWEHYNWKNQPERLVYTNRICINRRFWNQFEEIGKPGVIWCEVPDSDMHLLEPSKPEALPEPPTAPQEPNPTLPTTISRRDAAMALYTPPFKHLYGYIYDSKGLMVADSGDVEGPKSVEAAVASRVRGWGRIGYMPDAKALQDEVGVMMAEALTLYYTTHMKPVGFKEGNHG